MPGRRLDALATPGGVVTVDRRAFLRGGAAAVLALAASSSARSGEARALARPGLFLYGEEDGAELSLIAEQVHTAGLDVDVGVYADVTWSELEGADGSSSADAARLEETLSKAFLLQSSNSLPVVMRFKVVEPGKALPRVLANEASRVGRCRVDGKMTWSPNRCGWGWSSFQEAHAEVIESIARWFERREVRLGWIEVGSYGIWGEWHFEPRNRPLRRLYADASDAARFARPYADAFGSRWRELPFMIAWDYLNHQSDTEPFELARSIHSILPGHGLRVDMLGNRGQTDYFLGRLKEAQAAGLAFSGPFGGEAPNKDRDTVRWEDVLLGRLPEYPVPVSAFGGQRSGHPPLDIARLLAGASATGSG